MNETKYARLSLVSTLSTGVLTSVHHLYELRYAAGLLALLVVVLPFLSMQWFKRTSSSVALWLYGLLTAWLVVGFGVADGLWNHVIRTFGYYEVLLPAHGGDARLVEKTFSWAPPAVGNALFEGTGILTFVAALAAAYFGVKFIRSRNRLAAEGQNSVGGQHV